MNTKNKYRHHGLCRGLVSAEKLDMLISFTKIKGDFVIRGLHAHFVRGFCQKNTTMIYYATEGNFNRDVKKIRHIAANHEELFDFSGDVNNLEPGAVEPRKLEILIDSTQLTSKTVITILNDYYVDGKSKLDITKERGVTNSNLNREIRKIQRIADKFQELRNLELNQLSDR
ncbi:MAG: PapB/FocB family fimbrial expression transcriptional regulator [Pseudoalteromonas tetraodonis]